MLTSACGFDWTKPLLATNLGFLYAAPAVAAFAAIAVMGLRGQQQHSSGKAAGVRGWGAIHLPPT
jgi:hypothetical protein